MDIEELKKLQKEIICIRNILFTVFVMAIILIFVLFMMLSPKQSQMPNMPGMMKFMFVVVTILIIYIIMRNILLTKRISKFTKMYKNLFVVDSLKNVFGDISYNPSLGIEEQTLKDTGLINTHDRYESNDYIKSNFKGIEFVQSDIHIEEEVEYKDSDGNTQTTWETVFFGRWLIFDFNKKFKNDLIVVSNSFNESLLRGYDFKKVSLEDILFNKSFKVYAKDEHEAFYILTPSFMEKLMKVTELINGGLLFMFVDSKLHVAINNYEDSFECNVFKKINEEAIKENITKDIKVITDLVEGLDLDNNLFKGVN